MKVGTALFNEKKGGGTVEGEIQGDMRKEGEAIRCPLLQLREQELL